MDDEFENEEPECPECDDPTISASSFVRAKHRHRLRVTKPHRLRGFHYRTIIRQIGYHRGRSSRSGYSGIR